MKYTSAIAATASGSIGGATASHNRGGQYFRRRAIPVNPNTAEQQAVRGLFAAMSSRWVQVLTAAQRDAWDTYALNTTIPGPLGVANNVGGKGMYIRGNMPRIIAGLSPIDAGPTVQGIPTLSLPGVTSLVASTGVLTFTFTNTDTWAGSATGALLVFVSRPLGPATNYFDGPFQFAGRRLGATTPPTSPGTVTSPFTYTAGRPGRARFVAVTADGRLSGEYILPFLST